jgi:hypothetical protein
MLEDALFADDGSEVALRVAVVLGLAAGTLEVIDGPTDQRTGTLLSEPPPPPPVPVQPTFAQMVVQASSFEEFKALVAAKIA